MKVSLKITKFSKIILLFTTLLLLNQIVSLIFFDNGSSLGHIAFRLFENVMMIVVIFIPMILEKISKIKMHKVVEVALVGFAFSALILGDIFDFYGKFAWWDIALHGISGLMLGAIALVIADAFITTDKLEMSVKPLFVSVWIVCFALALGSIWEIWEYLSDGIFGLNSQEFLVSSGTFDSATPLLGREALKDTMEDLMLDFIGALVIAIISFVKSKK